MGFLKPTQPRRGCAAFGPGAIPRRALPTPPAPWRRPLAALVLAGGIGTMGMVSQSAAAAEVDPSAGHHETVADSSGHSGKQSSVSAKSSYRSRQSASPRRAANSDRDCEGQSTPRRAYSDRETSRSSSNGSKSSGSTTGKKSGYTSTKSGTTSTKSGYTSTRYSGSSKSSTSKKYNSWSKKSGYTSNKKRTSFSSSGGSYSSNRSYSSNGSGTNSSSGTSSNSSTVSSDAAASSSTPAVNGAAAPLAKGSYRIGAAFGATGSWSRYHTGQDFAASSGTPVYAATSGTVISGNVGSWAGNYVVIRAADGSSTLYAHMSNTDVKVGQQVTAGQKIGNVGSTGRSFGAHLHFEYYPSGVTPGNVYSATNPMSYLRSIGISM
ncbi:M23 family metallopeptidase [Arachnia propionica]|uniref:M23 family metallopeptidase n=1 Tax=Arachnia propionica TaxID=1750 RepID=UPI0028E38888|nr:M23 family metallopeptidase [Arachnia propionica]